MVENVVFIDPELDKNQVINRYLDLPKFVDLLRTNELHLEPAVNFSDQLEGTLPELIRQRYIEAVSKKERGFKSVEVLEYENKLRTNLSCWTLGPEDNMALWKIFGGSKESIAISTIVERIISSAFNWCEEGKINIKKVLYINHAEKLPDGVYSLDEHTFGLKHEAYFFEREVRIIISRPYGSNEKILRLPVDVNNFLTKITVSPLAREWFYNLVTDIAEKYKLTVPVKKSDLSFLIDKAEKKYKGQP